MNIFQFKAVIFSFVISLILIISLFFLIEQHSVIQIEINKQYYQRKDIERNILPKLNDNIKKRHYLLHSRYNSFQNFIIYLEEINRKSKSHYSLILQQNKSIQEYMFSTLNNALINSSLWGIDSLSIMNSLEMLTLKEQKILDSIYLAEDKFQKYLNRNKNDINEYDIAEISRFSLNKNSQLKSINNLINKESLINTEIIQKINIYSRYSKLANIRIFTYMTILLLIVFILLLVYSIRYFIQPLIIMDNASRKIISQHTSLKEIHIPYLGNNYYGRLGLAIRKMVTYLSEIDVVKGNILSQVTHDLKSPLATVGQGLEILYDDSYGKLSEKQKEIIKLMGSGYTTMSKLINNLVNAAKIEYDSYKIHFSKFDLVPLFKEVLNEYYLTLKKKNIKIYFNRKRWKKFVVAADHKGLEDVLRNLIGNAIKFTPENGEIYVELDLINYDVYIKIKDTGIGIPHEDLDKIFEKLYRAKNSKKISVQGTGLGLFIVKNIIQKHNGEITVHSEVGKGTVFEIHFPRFQSSREIIDVEEGN